MNQSTQLSLEQQFKHRKFADQVKLMSHKQAQEFLIMIHKQMMIQETMYQHFLLHEWNLDSGMVSKKI
jgi:Phycobilisome degradation protein nblA